MNAIRHLSFSLLLAGPLVLGGCAGNLYSKANRADIHTVQLTAKVDSEHEMRYGVDASQPDDLRSVVSTEMMNDVGQDGLRRMKLVMKKYPGTKWADQAAFHLLENKLCGDWQGASKCPEKESEMYEKYAKEHEQSPSTPEALYQAAWRQSALIEIYKTEANQKKSEQAKARALEMAQKIVTQYAQSDWSARAKTLLFYVQQGVPTWGNASD